MIELLNILKKYKKKSYKKDDILFRENDICKEVGIVINGEIIIRSYSENGKEIIYNKIEKGSIFGANLIFSNNKRYRGNVVALYDSEIAYINKEELIDLLRENHDFLLSFLSNEANNMKELNYRVKLLSLDSAYDRLMFYLNIHDGKTKISNVSNLAKELNIQRETLSRLLSKLNKEKVILYKNNEIIKI